MTASIITTPKISSWPKYKIDEYVTFGCIRRMEETHFANRLIPNAITRIILKYYLLINEWDPGLKSDFMTIRHGSNGTCVRNAEEFDGGNYGMHMRTIFGKNVISKGKHEWCFRIISETKSALDHYTTLIGIQDINEPPVLEGPFIKQPPAQNGYGLLGGTYKVTESNIPIVRFFQRILDAEDSNTEYGEQFYQTGDTMKMSLDMNSQELSYTIN
eukprot:257531_1